MAQTVPQNFASLTMLHMRSRILLVALLVAAVALCLIPATASAHVLKTDGTISAVLHVDPDDQPVSGTPTTYILFMDDSTNRFSLAGCDCIVSVIENGRTIAVQPLQFNSQGVPGGSVTFPKPDVYHLVFSGAPTKAGAFQPFTLDYLERVTQGPVNDPLTLSSAVWLSLVILMAAIALIACWFQLRYNSHEGESA